MDVFDWIDRELDPEPCTSDRFIYNDMDSQSGRCLPILYQPFDASNRSHWCDRGSTFDFLFATEGEGRRLLDLGPGDGWPSLVVAPYVREVVGVDASPRRVAVCTENALRLGIGNATFTHVPVGQPLPFPSDHVDGAMAASSIEQTPDPRATLAELHRVLRPGGRLRIFYESLAPYRDGREREVGTWPLGHDRCRLLLYDRDIEGERVVQVGLTFALAGADLEKALSRGGDSLSLATVTGQALERLRSTLVDARRCVTIHPCGRTLVAWLRDVGFRGVHPTRDGMSVARSCFVSTPVAARPRDQDGVDRLLRPLVREAITAPAPIDANPMITAIA